MQHTPWPLDTGHEVAKKEEEEEEGGGGGGEGEGEEEKELLICGG